MNKENNDFVIENYQSFCNACWKKYYLCKTYIEFEDYKQRVFLRFLKSNVPYDESKGLSKFGFMCMLASTEAFEIIRYHNTDSRFKDKYRIIPTMSEEEEERAEITLPYYDDYSNLFADELNKIIDKHLSDFQKEILKYRLNFYTYAYISRQLNTSAQNISSHVKRIKQKLEKPIKRYYK